MSKSLFAIVTLLACLGSAVAGGYGSLKQIAVRSKHDCDRPKDYKPCPFGKIYSPLYEGGTCVCSQQQFLVDLTRLITGALNDTDELIPASFADELADIPFSPNASDTELASLNDALLLEELTIGEQFESIFAYLQSIFVPGVLTAETDRAQLLASLAQSRSKYARIISKALLNINFNLIWDVISCSFVPTCENGFVWNAIEQRCSFITDIDCSAQCKQTCNGEACKQCKDLVLDRGVGRCVKGCNLNQARCIFGFHFDPKKCKCVPNTCTYNLECLPDQHFDEQTCSCVQGRACGENTHCSLSEVSCPIGWHYSNMECRCVRDPCPPGYVLNLDLVCELNPGCDPCPEGASLIAGTCLCACPEPGQQFVPATRECVCQVAPNCTDPQILNITACACQCPNITCDDGFVLDEATCTCVCGEVSCIGGDVDPVTCNCICPEGLVYDPILGVCLACIQDAACLPTEFFDNTTCACLPITCNLFEPIDIGGNCCNVTLTNGTVIPTPLPLPIDVPNVCLELGASLNPENCTCMNCTGLICLVGQVQVFDTTLQTCVCVNEFLCPILECPIGQVIDLLPPCECCDPCPIGEVFVGPGCECGPVLDGP